MALYPDSGSLGRTICFYFRTRKYVAYIQSGKSARRSLDTKLHTPYQGWNCNVTSKGPCTSAIRMMVGSLEIYAGIEGARTSSWQWSERIAVVNMPAWCWCGGFNAQCQEPRRCRCC